MLPEQEVRSLRILHMALITGCALFLAVASQFAARAPGMEGLATAFLAVGVVSMGLIVLSFLLFRRRMRMGIDPSLPEGSSALRTALILHWALIEAPCMLNTVLYLLTDSFAHAVLAASGLFVLVGRAPTETRFLRWTMPTG
ncbi:MAG: hypothetical protein QY325_11655 [Flavobacteriales bacterium]|nr:MAG: hypothetical protein QY325_11655 [Flavobacteriales bacterium]